MRWLTLRRLSINCPFDHLARPPVARRCRRGKRTGAVAAVRAGATPIVLALAVALAGPSIAQAEQVEARSDCRSSGDESSWYGWEILVADAAAFGVGAALTRVDGLAGRDAFFGLYAIAGPLVHLHHRQGDTAIFSLALRIGLPLFTAGTYLNFAGHSAAQTAEAFATDAIVGPIDGVYLAERVLSGQRSFDGGLRASAIAGIAAASVLDATLLALPSLHRRASPTNRTARWVVVPFVTNGRSGPALSVLGTF